MRTALAMLVFVLVVSVPVDARQATSLDGKLTDIFNRMESKDAGTRETSFDDLAELWDEGKDVAVYANGSGIAGYRNVLINFFSRHPEQAERLKLGLIRLLGTENNAMKHARAGSMDEDYGEYVFALTQAVSALKDDRAIPVLVEAISRSGVDLVQYGDKALEPVLAQLKNPDDLTKAKALEVALAILQVKNDAASRARVKALILSSLDDGSGVLRGVAVNAIDCLNDRETFVSTLNDLARNDPFKLPGKASDGGDGNEFYPVRYDARRVLREIESKKACTP